MKISTFGKNQIIFENRISGIRIRRDFMCRGFPRIYQKKNSSKIHTWMESYGPKREMKRCVSNTDHAGIHSPHSKRINDFEVV